MISRKITKNRDTLKPEVIYVLLFLISGMSSAVSIYDTFSFLLTDPSFYSFRFGFPQREPETEFPRLR